MPPKPTRKRPTKPSPKRTGSEETWQQQIASFVGFFIYLLILKSFFLPLFIIPTGSMAQGLYGQHGLYTCPNCGTEYTVGWQDEKADWPWQAPYIQCPNCRWQLHRVKNLYEARTKGLQPDELLTQPLRDCPGDRIFVHGWPYEPRFASIADLGPQRWDVVVFKVPTDGVTNYIKRLIGLPGEKIELIDGDVFVNDAIATKTGYAQQSLWFSYYNHDHPPAQAARRQDYFPQWVASADDSAWTGLDTRVPSFDDHSGTRHEIHFATDPEHPDQPGDIEDIYDYNQPAPRRVVRNIVPDVRLSAEVQVHDATDANADGYVELCVTSGGRDFFARLDHTRTFTLETQPTDGDEREIWDVQRLPADVNPVQLTLAHLDGQVIATANGRFTLKSSAEQYQLTPDDARRRGANARSPRIAVAAANANVTLRHLTIERDVYYVSGLPHVATRGFGVQGHPIELGPDEFFLLGDNSPNSQDGRFAFAHKPSEAVGPHLVEAYQEGEFRLGRVPRDQLVGPAFFVYWPGFMPVTSHGPNILPDFGRVRWIR